MTGSRYDGDAIYEWNLDGLSEYQILNFLQEMTMAAGAYRIKGNNDQSIVNIIIAGFTGQLKGWWDNYVSPEDKARVLSSKKIIVKTENNIQIQTEEDDMVNTLIFTIMKSFVGNPTHFQTRASETLINLTCPTLTDFELIHSILISLE